MKFDPSKDALLFSLESPKTFHTAVDFVMKSLGSSVQLLGYGEALHGGEEILQLRNKLFHYLVENYGFRSIAIESSFPRAHVTNEYILGKGPKSFDEIQETGFGSAFGKLEANRKLVEWMKGYNTDPAHKTKLRFYGLDIPSGSVGIGSPRQVLNFVLDYLESIDKQKYSDRRKKITELLGKDEPWESPEAHMDPSKSIGLSPNANALRIETEELISELKALRPEFIEKSDRDSFLEVLQHAKVARGLLNFHASMARKTTYAERLGIRDTLQADNLLYMVNREQGRGKVFAFAHNSHLKKGKAEWQLGPELITWWPAGSLVHSIIGNKYAVIGTALGESQENGIAKPESGTFEAQLSEIKDPWSFIPTHGGEGFSKTKLRELSVRSSSKKNPTYFPLTAQSFTDFDWITFVKETGYNKGGPHLQDWDADPTE